MDPVLAALFAAGPPDEQLAILMRMASPETPPPAGVHVVSRFGPVLTARAARGQIALVRADPSVRSVKAPRYYAAEVPLPAEAPVDTRPGPRDTRRPADVDVAGRGVLVAVVDWGFDLTHPAFRAPDGRTRVHALWDQQPGPDPANPNRFGYGRIFDRLDIDAALASADPRSALGYDWSVADAGRGCHGTATASVAAGSPWPGGLPGVAPHADLVFVHLSTWGPSGPADIGDSVALVEAVDFVREAAAGRPWVLNLSMGSHHGPHDGRLLVEQALDAAASERPGAAIVQSCGNYHGRQIHTEGQLRAQGTMRLPMLVPRGTLGPVDVDVWYSGQDRLVVGVAAPDGAETHSRADSDGLGVVVEPQAEIRHRSNDPNNGASHAVVRLPAPEPGRWNIVLAADDVVDGRFHVWIGRSVGGGAQPRFVDGVDVARTVTGTISNGWRTVSVGAYDADDPAWPVTSFSSGGPTVDGRGKPNLLAPGQDVLVARSAPARAVDDRAAGTDQVAALGTRMSGTSMAAPHVTGAIACLFERAGPLPSNRLRPTLLLACEPYRGPDAARAGYGYLDLTAALKRLEPGDHARSIPAEGRSPREEHRTDTDDMYPELAMAQSFPEAVPTVRLAPARSTVVTSPGPRPAPPPPPPEPVPPPPPPPQPPAGGATRPLDARPAFDPLDLLDRSMSSEPSPRVEPGGAPGSEPPDPASPGALPTGPAPTDPDAVLGLLGTTPRDLRDAYLLGRRPDVVARLGDRVMVLTEPYGQVGHLQSGDLLVRSSLGEGQTLVAGLVDGMLLDRDAAQREGWMLEGAMPGRYALVVDSASPGRSGLWARQITDGAGYLPDGHVVLRVAPVASTAATGVGGSAVGMSGAPVPVEPPAPLSGSMLPAPESLPPSDGMVLSLGQGQELAVYAGPTDSGPYGTAVPVRSPAEFEGIFGPSAGPGDLGNAVRFYLASGGTQAVVVRMPPPTGPASPSTTLSHPAPARQPVPASPAPEVTPAERPKLPVRKDKPYVRWYQQAFNDIEGAGLVVDGISGRLTKAAVRAFQSKRPPLVVDGFVGPQTEAALIAAGAPTPPGTAPPLPSGPPGTTPPEPIPPAAPPDATPPEPPLVVPTPPPSTDALPELERRFFPPSGSKNAAPITRTLATEVRPLVDGAAYFSAIAAEADRLGRGDSWYLANWIFEAGFRLPDGRRLADLLEQKAAEGVDVRVVLWASRWALERARELRQQKGNEWILEPIEKNVCCAESLRSRAPLQGRVLLDWSGEIASSHHMKCVAFRRGTEQVAFAGGIDFAQNRVDRPPHRNGWHDAGVAVTGTVAQRIHDTIVTRWKEAATLPPATYDAEELRARCGLGTGRRAYNPAARELVSQPEPAALVPLNPDTAVQVVRTFPTIKEPAFVGGRYSVGPWSDPTLQGGVFEVLTTLRRALGAARRYIYIEDQLFTASETLFPALVEACRRGVKVAVLMPSKVDPMEGDKVANEQLTGAVRDGILAKLSVEQRKNIAVWRHREAYVHAKLVLVDDEFGCIGSANFQDRSMRSVAVRVPVPLLGTVPITGTDSELSVATVTTGSLLRDLRTQLWAEHFQVGPEHVRDLGSALGFWRSSWGTGGVVRGTSTQLTFVGPD